MKKLYPAIAFLICISATASPVSVKAQFLKNVLNSVKNTVQNKANDKATQVTNKAIDNVDGTNKTKTNKTTTNAPVTPSKTDSSSTITGQQASSNSSANKAASDSGTSYIKLNVSSNKILAGGYSYYKWLHCDV